MGVTSDKCLCVCVHSLSLSLSLLPCPLFGRRSRKTIDNTETHKQFGPIEIFYGKVS